VAASLFGAFYVHLPATNLLGGDAGVVSDKYAAEKEVKRWHRGKPKQACD